MKRFITAAAVLAVLAFSGSVRAQNQINTTSNSWVSYTIAAADTNLTTLVVTNIDMSKVYGVTLYNTGTVDAKYKFTTLQGTTNLNLIVGPTLSAGGSVTYCTGTRGGIPSFPLSAKSVSNGVSTTFTVETLRRP